MTLVLRRYLDRNFVLVCVTIYARFFNSSREMSRYINIPDVFCRLRPCNAVNIYVHTNRRKLCKTNQSRQNVGQTYILYRGSQNIHKDVDKKGTR